MKNSKISFEVGSKLHEDNFIKVDWLFRNFTSLVYGINK